MHPSCRLKIATTLRNASPIQPKNHILLGRSSAGQNKTNKKRQELHTDQKEQNSEKMVRENTTKHKQKGRKTSITPLAYTHEKGVP